MRSATICLCLAVVFSATVGQSQSNNFTIEAQINGDYSGPVAIYFQNDSIKSTVTDKKFTVTGKIDHPIQASLTVPGSLCGSRFYLENSKIQLVIDAVLSAGSKKYCLYIKQVTGSKSDSSWKAFTKSKESISAKNPGKKNPLLFKQLITDFIKENPHLGYSANLITENYSAYGSAWAQEMYASLSEAAFETREGKLLQKWLQQKNNDKPGMKFPDFNLPDVSGKNFSSASLTGKYVLYDFWASWCGPCRRENPTLVNNYNKYHERGFEIVGISLDKQKAELVTAIKEDALPWIHVLDWKNGKFLLADRHNVSSIPYNILVDPAGNIIATNLRGEHLSIKLKEIFAE